MATKTWNQTSGNLASTDANWSPATKPEAGDDVVFDGTSTANCTWDLAIACATFTIASGYTGTITRSSDFSMTDWTIASATAVFTGSGWVTVNGDMTKSAGGTTTFPEDSLALRFQGTKNCSLDTIVYPSHLEVVTGTRTMTAGSSYFQGRYHTKIYSGATFTLNQGAGTQGFANRMAYWSGWTYINEGTINGNAKATFFYIVGEGSTPATITFGVINCPVTIENYYVSSNRTLYLGANTSFGSTLLIQSDDTKTITLDHGTNYTLNVTGIVTLGNYGKMTPGSGAWTFGSLVQSGTGSAFTQGGAYLYLHDLTATAGTFTGDSSGWQWVYASGDISFADGTLAPHTLNLRMTADGGSIVVVGESSIRNLEVYGNTTITDLSELRDALTVNTGKTLTNNDNVLHDTWAGSFDITNNGTVNGTGTWTVRILYGWTMGCTKLGNWNCPFEVKNSDASNDCIFNIERNESLGSTLKVYSDTTKVCTLHHNSNYTLDVAGVVTVGDYGKMVSGTGAWTFASYNQNGTSASFVQGSNLKITGTSEFTAGVFDFNGFSIEAGGNVGPVSRVQCDTRWTGTKRIISTGTNVTLYAVGGTSADVTVQAGKTLHINTEAAGWFGIPGATDIGAGATLDITTTGNGYIRQLLYWGGSFTNAGTLGAGATGSYIEFVFYDEDSSMDLGNCHMNVKLSLFPGTTHHKWSLPSAQHIEANLSVIGVDTGYMEIHHGGNNTLTVDGSVSALDYARLTQGTGQWWFASYTQSALAQQFTSGGYFRCIGTVSIDGGGLYINADAMVNALAQSDGAIFVAIDKYLWYTYTWTHTGGTYSGLIEQYIFSDTDAVGLSDVVLAHKALAFEEVIAFADSLYSETPPATGGGPAVSTSASKYLLKKWHEDREKALIDQSLFTTAELEWLEITSQDPVVSKDNDEEWLIDNQPIDPLKSSTGRHDVRKRPEAGG